MYRPVSYIQPLICLSYKCFYQMFVQLILGLAAAV